MTPAQALLLEALTGRSVPIPVAEGECPPEVPKDVSKNYLDLSRLVVMPEFHTFLRLVREGQMAVVSGLRSDTATPKEMRSSLAKQELSLTLGDFALQYMLQVEGLIEARKNWLEENNETGDASAQVASQQGA